MCLLGGAGVVHSNNARLRGVECRQPGFDGGGVGVGGDPATVAMVTVLPWRQARVIPLYIA